MTINLEQWINEQTKEALMLAGESQGRLTILVELLKFLTEGQNEEPNLDTVDSGN